MEAGATETGCIFREHGHECRKLTESGTLMCPHHNLLTKHREEEREKKKSPPPKKKQAQRVTPYYPD
jgi:hypothetical protein